MRRIHLSQHRWRQIRTYIYRFVAIYIAALAVFYILLSHAQSTYASYEIYWEETAGIATDVADSKPLQRTIDVIGTRPSPEGCADKPSTKNVTPWAVLDTWMQLRKSTNTMKQCAINQLEWAHVVIDTESRMTSHIMTETNGM